MRFLIILMLMGCAPPSNAPKVTEQTPPSFDWRLYNPPVYHVHEE